jgi:GT2 family glycosyltransferase
LNADASQPRSVDWVSGAAVWLRRSALDTVGGWDERYFMYMEDLDLCWRLRSAGWDVAFEPGGSVVHVQGAVTSRQPYRMLIEHHRSAWRFARRRFTGARALLLPFAAVYLAVRAVLAMAERAWRASGRG